MRNPSSRDRRAETQYETSSAHIVSPALVDAQDLKQRSPLTTSGDCCESLPSLTDLIEFLERIQRSHPIIQRIAIRLYARFTGIDQRHLYHIADIRFEAAGGPR
jgi:hypothetical protein